MSSPLHIICAISSQEEFDDNLGRSPCLVMNGGLVPLTCRHDWKNVPAAYNDLWAVVDSKYIAFVHQDIFLPEGWDSDLLAGIAKIEADGDKWWHAIGVAGTVWTEQTVAGEDILVKQYAGNYMDREEHSPNEVALPCRCETIDEMVIVVRGENNVRFDEQLPYHHLMAADFCYQGKASVPYTVDAYCEHNCKGKWKALPVEFAICAGYMWGKWHDRLPITTNCATICEEDGVCKIVA